MFSFSNFTRSRFRFWKIDQLDIRTRVFVFYDGKFRELRVGSRRSEVAYLLFATISCVPLTLGVSCLKVGNCLESWTKLEGIYYVESSFSAKRMLLKFFIILFGRTINEFLFCNLQKKKMKKIGKKLHIIKINTKRWPRYQYLNLP